MNREERELHFLKMGLHMAKLTKEEQERKWPVVYQKLLECGWPREMIDGLKRLSELIEKERKER